MMAGALKEVNDENFEAEIAEGFTLVDFYADWCGPCRMMTPVLEEFAEAKNGQIAVAKLDIEASQQVTQNLGINSVPTLILFHKGNEIERVVGVRDLETLTELIDSAVAKV